MLDTAVVVGAGPGLGRAVAQAFVADGTDVALVARSADRLDDLAAEVTAETGREGGTAHAVPADVTDPAAVDEAFETIRSDIGPVDALVSTLYGTDVDGGGPDETTPTDLHDAWRVEVEGVYRCVRAALPDLERGDDGAVVLTNSGAADDPSGDDLARGVARGGLENLATGLADALEPEGVRVVHGVIDGWLGTPALRAAYPDRPESAWVDPDAVAREYRRLANREPTCVTREMRFQTLADGTADES